MDKKLPMDTTLSQTYRRVLLVSTLVFVLASIVFTVFKRSDWFPWIGDCYPNADPGHFLAYCHSVRYGDYEHYAYYHEVEKEAVAAAKSAPILFLGSSNTQFAFSTKAVDEFFTAKNTQHYVLGFGHGAQSGVASAVIDKLQLTPNVVVVNADPFFTGEVNDTFARVLEGDSEYWGFLPTWLQPNLAGEHERKRRLQMAQQARCSSDSRSQLWCEGRVDTLHRNAANGHWVVEHYRETLKLPTGEDRTSHLDKLARYSEVATEFVDQLGIDERCLVITASPRSNTPRVFAKELANGIGASFVSPSVDQLKTLDGFHLDADSAERWSAAFMVDLNPILNACLD